MPSLDMVVAEVVQRNGPWVLNVTVTTSSCGHIRSVVQSPMDSRESTLYRFVFLQMCFDPRHNMQLVPLSNYAAP